MFERMQSLFLVEVPAPEATLANLLGPAPPRGGTQDSERITGIRITLVRAGSVAWFIDQSRGVSKRKLGVLTGVLAFKLGFLEPRREA